ncbi:O-methyltransferase [Jackrogersella minutella]|nr:O-methyltransferase [Jackrogersella minutella]
MPFFLEKTGFKNVEGPPDPFQDAHGTEDNMLPWLMKDPQMMNDFNSFMTGQRAGRKQWFLRYFLEVIDSIQDLTLKVERQKYDFLLPQPVKGKILKNTAEAMTPGYSKLLLSDFVLPAINTPLYPALLDVNMMAVLNEMERTEAQFSQVLDAAGLKVAKFRSVGAEIEGFVEAVLKD